MATSNFHRHPNRKNCPILAATFVLRLGLAAGTFAQIKLL
jgi:hypothetical protein